MAVNSLLAKITLLKEPATWTHLNDGQRRDRILRLFLRPEIGQLSPHFGAISLQKKENLEKRKKIHWRKFKESSGETSPKLQISVPCRGRTCPE